MTILNVGYGTTDPQELLHLVQSNVTLILKIAEIITKVRQT